MTFYDDDFATTNEQVSLIVTEFEVGQSKSKQRYLLKWCLTLAILVAIALPLALLAPLFVFDKGELVLLEQKQVTLPWSCFWISDVSFRTEACMRSLDPTAISVYRTVTLCDRCEWHPRRENKTEYYDISNVPAASTLSLEFETQVPRDRALVTIVNQRAEQWLLERSVDKVIRTHNASRLSQTNYTVTRQIPHLGVIVEPDNKMGFLQFRQFASRWRFRRTTNTTLTSCSVLTEWPCPFQAPFISEPMRFLLTGTVNRNVSTNMRCDRVFDFHVIWSIRFAIFIPFLCVTLVCASASLVLIWSGRICKNPLGCITCWKRRKPDQGQSKAQRHSQIVQVQLQNRRATSSYR